MVAVDHKSIHQVRNQNDCSGINKLFLAYFHQGQNNKQIVKMIQQLLRAREIDRRTQKQLLSAIGTPVKKKENSTASDINSFSMLESLLSRSRSRTDLEQTILIDQQLLQQLKLVENPVMREIVEIVLALKSGNIFWAGREWVYKNIKPRIVCESFLEDGSGALMDYKFHCFNGKSKFVQVNLGRGDKNHVQNFYDLDWNMQEFGKELSPSPNIKISPPNQLKRMIRIAEDLSSDFLYARVDFYEVNNKITLIRGHGYPNSDIINGFNWENENTNPYEFDSGCNSWEFYPISNGHMLNCYPEQIIWQDELLLKTLKEL